MSTPEERKIHPGWTKADLGDIAEIVRGIAFPKDAKHLAPGKGLVACLRTSNVQAQVDWSDLWFIPESFVKRSEQRVKPQDILISISNSLDLVGKVAQVTQVSHEATLGAFIALIRFDQALDPRFFYFQLSAAETQAKIRQMASTTTNISNIATGKLASLPLLIPPRAEQSRIASEIERNLTLLDSSGALLRRVRANLKRYRAAVLKAACEGRLVPKETATSSWTWSTLGELSWDSDYGTSQKCDYAAGGPPVLRIPNILRGSLDLTDLKRATKGDELTVEKAVRPGDFLIVRTNGSKDLIGRAALIRQPLSSAHFFASYLIRFRLKGAEILHRWIALFWETADSRARLEAAAATSAGQYNVSMRTLEKLPIPVPPAAEIERILQEAERRLSVMGSVEAALSKSFLQAETLRRSILRQAFEGALVPQNPTDEPASVLLERIRQEREAAAANQPRRRGRRPATKIEKPRSRGAAR